MDQIFIMLGAVMLIGVGLFILLRSAPKEILENEKEASFKIMGKLVFDPRILLLLPSQISGGFLLGLVLGSIPVVIAKNFGIGWVGILTSLFDLTLALVLITAGYLSDIKG